MENIKKFEKYEVKLIKQKLKKLSKILKIKEKVKFRKIVENSRKIQKIFKNFNSKLNVVKKREKSRDHQ